MPLTKPTIVTVTPAVIGVEYQAASLTCTPTPPPIDDGGDGGGGTPDSEVPVYWYVPVDYATYVGDTRTPGTLPPPYGYDTLTQLWYVPDPSFPGGTVPVYETRCYWTLYDGVAWEVGATPAGGQPVNTRRVYLEAVNSTATVGGIWDIYSANSFVGTYDGTNASFHGYWCKYLPVGYEYELRVVARGTSSPVRNFTMQVTVVSGLGDFPSTVVNVAALSPVPAVGDHFTVGTFSTP